MNIDAPMLALLDIFYRKVDEEIVRLADLHGNLLTCRRGCATCCIDELSVFAVEAAYIICHHPGLLKEMQPNPEGACAFLDSAGGCRIYEHRPYVCRTQGLPFRWVEYQENGERTEWRDICPSNSENIAIMELPEDACLTLGPFEGRLAELQEAAFRNRQRVALRSLFEKH